MIQVTPQTREGQSISRVSEGTIRCRRACQSNVVYLPLIPVRRNSVRHLATSNLSAQCMYLRVPRRRRASDRRLPHCLLVLLRSTLRPAYHSKVTRAYPINPHTPLRRTITPETAASETSTTTTAPRRREQRSVRRLLETKKSRLKCPISIAQHLGRRRISTSGCSLETSACQSLNQQEPPRR